MKKNYIVIIALLFSAGVFAQIQNHQAIHLTEPVSIPSIPHNSAGVVASHLWLEYDSADAYNYIAPQTHILQWLVNKRYPAGFAHNPNYPTFQYYIVKFDSLYDVNTMSATDPSTVSTITVDSIYAVIGHQNSSHTQDTIVARIINVNASHYPGTTTLWADTTYTSTSLSPFGNWHSPIRLVWKPNYSNAMKSFAVEIDYYGSKADTCGFVAGFNNLGASGACTYRANASTFYPNSYAAWTDYLSIYPLIPDATGADLTQDCDQDGGGFDNLDGYNYLQDIIVGAYITVNSTTGIEDLKNTGIGLSQNIPNPLHNSTSIKYELANNTKEVTLYIYDIVGNKVMEVKEGNKASGKYTIHVDATKLAKGMYTYTLRADGRQLTRRMIVE